MVIHDDDDGDDDDDDDGDDDNDGDDDDKMPGQGFCSGWSRGRLRQPEGRSCLLLVVIISSSYYHYYFFLFLVHSHFHSLIDWFVGLTSCLL